MEMEMSVQDVAAYLEEHPETPLIDVRESFEREICQLPTSRQLTEELAEEMLAHWQRDVPVIFYCHHGGRSRAAAEYFQQQGFLQVRNMTGGIEAWSLQVNPAIPRY